MTEVTWAALRELLTHRYTELKGRLTRHLGSEELASESLHEAWLRLHRSGPAGPVQNPPAYLLRMAVNIALDGLRAQSRRARRSDVKAVLEVADPAAGPEREAFARRDLEIVNRALETLPERTRAILVAARLEGLNHQAIADRFGISRRTVVYEMKRAVEHLDAALDYDPPEGCASPSGETSS